MRIRAGKCVTHDAKRSDPWVREASGIAVYAESKCTCKQTGEATMELRMRMNVLAALMSFTFIAAVALGIV
jgi:hypothetical protein